jgi:hypothetical protein
MIVETKIGLEFKVPKGPRLKSIREFQLDEGIVVATFDGDLSDLDFMVKYLDEKVSKSLRTPSYCMIGVDLLMKAQQNKELTKDFVIEFIQIWDKMVPPTNTDERDNYVFDFEDLLGDYSELNFYGEMSIEMLSTVINLYILSERVKPNVKKFRSLLESIVHYCDDNIDYFSLISKIK